MEEETEVGKIDDTPGPPIVKLPNVDATFPIGPSVDGVGPGPGKPICKSEIMLLSKEHIFQ